MEPDLESATHCERDHGRENCEIEITPEMVNAGIAKLVAYNPRFDLEEDAVCSIFTAMLKAARAELKANLGKIAPQKRRS